MSAKSFVVFGLGKFGYSVAVSLYKNGCDVLAVDCDEEKVEDIARDVTYAVKANVIDPDIYESLGIGNMDGAVIAISDNIEASIMAAIHAKEAGIPYSTISNMIHRTNIPTIPKTVQPERMAENLDVFDFALTEREMESIAGMDIGHSEIIDHRCFYTARQLNSVKIHE